jgi:REP element-mobilizing transposase RayT
MRRQLRLQYHGAMYHVISRGNRREKIFLDDVDRQDFIKTLAEACQKTGWQVHAYCLMPNHYHLVLETLEPSLVAGMAWLQSTYTSCTATCRKERTPAKPSRAPPAGGYERE